MVSPKKGFRFGLLSLVFGISQLVLWLLLLPFFSKWENVQSLSAIFVWLLWVPAVFAIAFGIAGLSRMPRRYPVLSPSAISAVVDGGHLTELPQVQVDDGLTLQHAASGDRVAAKIGITLGATLLGIAVTLVVGSLLIIFAMLAFLAFLASLAPGGAHSM